MERRKKKILEKDAKNRKTVEEVEIKLREKKIHSNKNDCYDVACKFNLSFVIQWLNHFIRQCNIYLLNI